ncbi:hypothetical protein A3A84_04050 [Candidatus Collierbacteria bacterium RIFCSPLOWO2_01_FULL_50_23]|nr:MAG: hypothetical protein A3A84_04050 [Candidatus Collierbacteria bacterium RIFCSPLOWO2_01_FULL_50_23]
MKQKNPIQRRIVNLLALLVIVAVGLTANRYYAAGTKTAQTDINLPRVSTMKIVETKVEDEKVQVAIEVTSSDEAAITADLVSLYRWGRSKFRPVKCGEEYPPELCSIGEVHIFFLAPQKDVPSTTGELVDVYRMRLEIWLDQFQIDTFLNPSSGLTMFAEVNLFHTAAAEKNGGGIKSTNEIFTGLK